MRLPNGTATLCVIDGVRHLIDPDGEIYTWAPGTDPNLIQWSGEIITSMRKQHKWTHKQLATITGVTIDSSKKWCGGATTIQKPCRMLIWWQLKHPTD